MQTLPGYVLKKSFEVTLILNDLNVLKILLLVNGFIINRAEQFAISITWTVVLLQTGGTVHGDHFDTWQASDDGGLNT